MHLLLVRIEQLLFILAAIALAIAFSNILHNWNFLTRSFSSSNATSNKMSAEIDRIKAMLDQTGQQHVYETTGCFENGDNNVLAQVSFLFSR